MVVCAVTEVGVWLDGRGSRGALFRISEVEEDITGIDAEWKVCGALILLKLTQLDGLMGAQITWFGVIAGTGAGAGGLGSGETIRHENLNVKDEIGVASDLVGWRTKIVVFVSV